MAILYDISFILVALFALGFTIFIHELGHFLAARKRGLVIKRFSIGFGPRIFGWTKNGVEYRLSAIPFGGYVALPQLVDMGRLEGSEGEKQGVDKTFTNWDEFGSEKDEDSEKKDEDEEEGNDIHSENKPLPKISYTDKIIVSVMGAVFNVLLALVLSCFLGVFGYDVADSQLTTKIGFVSDTVERWNPHVERGEKIPGPAKKAGLLAGDRIKSVDGVQVEDFMQIQSLIVTGKGMTEEGKRIVTLAIERNGKEEIIQVQPAVKGSEEYRVIGIEPEGNFTIDALSEDMPAIKAGLEVGDQPVSIDGKRIHCFSQLQDYLRKTEDNQTVSLTVIKGGGKGTEQTYSLIPIEKEIEISGVPTPIKLIGFTPRANIVTTYPNPLVLITHRVKDMYHTLSGLISPKSDVKLRNMSGPVGIVNHLSIFAKIGFKKLLWFVVFINVNLAILNLLPIPVLDGGHMLFATIEKLRGKPLPLAFLERTQVIFIVLLFSFMLYVTFFDVQRLFP